MSYDELMIGFNELQDKNEKMRNYMKDILKALQHKEKELKKSRDRVKGVSTNSETEIQNVSECF